MVADIVSLTEIASPPFKEERRGAAYLAMFRAAGLTNVERDPEGNVLGLRKGTGGGPLVAIAAHLDTVFPEGTDVHVKRVGTKLSAPGVGDDTRSLAVLVAMIRAMNEAGVQTASDILFVGGRGRRRPGRLARDEIPVSEGPRTRTASSCSSRWMARARAMKSRMGRSAAGGTASRFEGRRPQLRRVRPGESGVCARKSRGKAVHDRRSENAQDHLQHRRDWRRHIDQFHPGIRMDGRGHAVGIALGPHQTRSGVPRPDERVRRGRECRAIRPRRVRSRLR